MTALSRISDLVSRMFNPTSSALDVSVQDQTSQVVDLHLMNVLASVTLANPVSVDDLTIDLEAGHGFVAAAGETICLQEGSNFYQAEVLSVATNEITVDTPVDSAFTVAATAQRGSNLLNVDGSSTPVVFRVSPQNLTGIQWDIVRIIFQITDDVAMDDGKFGGIAALTNGIVVRAKDGNTKNIFNAKSNGELASHMYDVVYSDKAPAGEYGLRARRTFGGQSKNGVVIRLVGSDSDELQVLVQDNLSALLTFTAIAQGHIVEE